VKEYKKRLSRVCAVEFDILFCRDPHEMSEKISFVLLHFISAHGYKGPITVSCQVRRVVHHVYNLIV
jgi:hypothetical protein